MAAAQFRLGNIVAFVDKNDMCMDGSQDDVMQVNPVDAKFAAFGWNVVTVDGHDVAALAAVVDALPPPDSDKPTVVVAQTDQGLRHRLHGGHDQVAQRPGRRRHARQRATRSSTPRYAAARGNGWLRDEPDRRDARRIGRRRQPHARCTARRWSNSPTEHPEVVALTADLMLSHQLKQFNDVHPDRFFNVGIAESNLMGVSAGLALDGKIPFVMMFAAFATMRAHEQVRTDIAYPGLPVKILGTMGGLSGGTAGPTHAPAWRTSARCG